MTGEPLVASHRSKARKPGRVRWVVSIGVASVLVAVVIWGVGQHRDKQRASGTTVVAVTLLDGRRLELRYPPSLGIAQLGLTLGTEMRWPGGATSSSCCWAHVSASHATVAEAYGSTRPLDTYQGVGGQPVWLFSAIDRRLPPGFTGDQNLVFQVAGWLVEVDTSAVGADRSPPPMTDQDRRMWAANLGTSVGAGGYLVLRPRPPLGIAPPDFIDRMSAAFGLGYPNEPQRNVLDIEDGSCGRPTSDTSRRSRFQLADGRLGVSWCLPGSGLHITAVGLRPFVDLVASKLTLAVSPSS